MRTIRLSILSLAVILAAPAAFAANSCDTLLCMAGKLQGQSGGSDCNQPIADYFNIEIFGRHGKFNPGATAAARLDYLNSCPAPGVGSWPTQINAVYGMVRN